MHPSLEHLIQLQQIETDASDRTRRLADLPARITAADAAVADARAARDAAAARAAENLAARRAADRELAVQQGRLTKFKDQLMEVKTNKEYTAMQHEIATAEAGVGNYEDQVLTLLMEADELTAAMKAAEAALAAQERTAAEVRTGVDAERARLEAELAALAERRRGVEGQMPPDLVRLFADTAAKRRGIAVSAVHDGHCQACQVRLRPQLIMDVRRGEHVVQCESCARILYVPPPAPAPAAPSGAASDGRA
jgi:predicted  nucleic acid-binding Zn-ribbon protein